MYNNIVNIPQCYVDNKQHTVYDGIVNNIQILMPDWIIPINPKNTTYKDFALVIENDTIIDIGEKATMMEKFSAAERIPLPDKVLIPGLINTHCHSAMVVMRGYADDYNVDTWLNDYIWPAEKKLLCEEYVYDGTLFACAEMLLSGTTCFADMYYYPKQVMEATLKSDMRAQIAFTVINFENNWAKNQHDALKKGMSLAYARQNHDKIKFALAPHAPYTTTPDIQKLISFYAHKFDMPIQIHLHENEREIIDSVKSTGYRPLQNLANIDGFVGPHLQAVHMTQISDRDLEYISRKNIQVIHCPESNAKTASGICPINKIMDADINVSLGTDGAGSNNDLSVLNEARTASMLAKLLTGVPTNIDAYTALEMATINGAKTLKMEDQIGTLEVGKKADCVAFDLSDISQQPIHNPISQLIYTNASEKVSDVWIGGEQLVYESELTKLNKTDIIQNIERWRNTINKIDVYEV